MTAPEWEDPRRALSRHALTAKKRFSQNFLTSRSAVENIAKALSAAPGELVVELGPGLGTLTGALLRSGAQVVAVEADADMIRVLRADFAPYPALRVTHGDAANVELASFGAAPLAVAGNLPYAVTGAIFRRLVEQHEQVDRAVFMVQREVRDRLLAPPGTKQFGALTVFTTAVFQVSSVCLVPAGAFHPKPKVDSAVVALRHRSDWISPSRPTFARAVRAAFETRRKTLRNALLRSFTEVEVDLALARAKIDGRRRGETLTVLEFDALANALAACQLDGSG